MDLERGGQLYVVYTGEAGREQYGVRVSGGTKIPVLDLSDTKDPAERLKLAEAYVNGLEAMVQDMEALHNRIIRTILMMLRTVSTEPRTS